MKRILGLFGLGLILLLAAEGRAQAPPGGQGIPQGPAGYPRIDPTIPFDASVRADFADWDRICRARVTPAGVDYLGLRKTDREALRGLLERMNGIDPRPMSGDDQVAFYLNLYNATLVSTILDRMRDGWSPASGDSTLFREPLVRVAHRRITLGDLANQVILRIYQSPSLLFALHGGTRSGPALLPRAYAGATVHQDVAEAGRLFVTDPTRVSLESDLKELRISRWLARQLPRLHGTDGLKRFVLASLPPEQRRVDLRPFELAFREEDTALDLTAPAGRWVRLLEPVVKRGGRELEAGNWLEVLDAGDDGLRLLWPASPETILVAPGRTAPAQWP